VKAQAACGAIRSAQHHHPGIGCAVGGDARHNGRVHRAAAIGSAARQQAPGSMEGSGKVIIHRVAMPCRTGIGKACCTRWREQSRAIRPAAQAFSPPIVGFPAKTRFTSR
jgi:hypothetical protein